MTGLDPVIFSYRFDLVYRGDASKLPSPDADPVVYDVFCQEIKGHVFAVADELQRRLKPRWRGMWRVRMADSGIPDFTPEQAARFLRES